MNLLLWMSLSLLLSPSISKSINFISNSIAARENQGILITKFTFQGDNARARLRGNDTIGGLYFFPRDKMLQIRGEDCNNYLKKASFSVFTKKSELKDRVFSLSWSDAPVTYFVLFVDASTCHKQYPPQASVSIELELLNDENAGGHLTVEENGLKTSYTLLLLLYAGAGAWFGAPLYTLTARGGQMLSVTRLFLLTTALQLLSLLLPLSHWIFNEYNGRGFPALLAVTTFTSIGSHLAMIGLIVDVVVGWTLGSSKRISTSKSELVYRVIAVLGVLHITLHFYIANLDTVDPHFYRFSSISEILQTFVWVSESCYFLAVLARTYQEDRSPLRKDFYASFAWILLEWLFSRPISHVIVLFLVEYNRLKTFVAVSQFIRWCALVHLAHLFVKRTVFWEVSELSATSIPFSERTAFSEAQRGDNNVLLRNGYEKRTKQS